MSYPYRSLKKISVIVLSFRGTSLLCVVGKVYGKVLGRKTREGTWGMICDEQGGSRRGRGCVYEICK